MSSDSEARMVILQLEDHTLATTDEHVLGGVQLPSGVRCRVDKLAVRSPRLLRRLGPGHVLLPEDPSQRGHDRGLHSQVHHLVVHADWSRVQPEGLQGGPDLQRLVLKVLGEFCG